MVSELVKTIVYSCKSLSVMVMFCLGQGILVLLFEYINRIVTVLGARYIVG